MKISHVLLAASLFTTVSASAQFEANNCLQISRDHVSKANAVRLLTEYRDILKSDLNDLRNRNTGLGGFFISDSKVEEKEEELKQEEEKLEIALAEKEEIARKDLECKSFTMNDIDGHEVTVSINEIRKSIKNSRRGVSFSKEPEINFDGSVMITGPKFLVDGKQVGLVGTNGSLNYVRESAKAFCQYMGFITAGNIDATYSNYYVTSKRPTTTYITFHNKHPQIIKLAKGSYEIRKVQCF